MTHMLSGLADGKLVVALEVQLKHLITLIPDANGCANIGWIQLRCHFEVRSSCG